MGHSRVLPAIIHASPVIIILPLLVFHAILGCTGSSPTTPVFALMDSIKIPHALPVLISASNAHIAAVTKLMLASLAMLPFSCKLILASKHASA